MTTLNKTAAEVITESQKQNAYAPQKEVGATNSEEHDAGRTTHNASPIHALTDITGFGLIGHLREMLLASENVSAEIHASRVSLLEGAIDCIRDRHIPGGLTANREFAECVVDYADEVTEQVKTILFDPQTAGGLLISVAQREADNLQNALRGAGVRVAEIGEVRTGTRPSIEVQP
jgi:selenide,water dikinase